MTGATCSRTCCRHRRQQLADASCFTSNTTTKKLSCKVKMGLVGWGRGCFFIYFFFSASIFAKFRSPCEVFSSSYSRTGLIPLNLTGGKFASRQGSERLYTSCPQWLDAPPPSPLRLTRENHWPLHGAKDVQSSPLKMYFLKKGRSVD